MPDGPYPDDWKTVSRRIRDRADGRCECTGQCGLHRGQRCVERDGEKAKFASGAVVLTVAHLNHYPHIASRFSSRQSCNTCHLRYDQALHATHAWQTRRERAGTEDMFSGK